MLRIVSHRASDAAADPTVVFVLDQAGPGGAHHQYVVVASESAAALDAEKQELNVQPGALLGQVGFQFGPIKESGHSGVQIEHLLAICAHRLACFQTGPFACRENALALTKIQEAMLWLQSRTRDRQSRGVEGQNQQ